MKNKWPEKLEITEDEEIIGLGSIFKWSESSHCFMEEIIARWNSYDSDQKKIKDLVGALKSALPYMQHFAARDNVGGVCESLGLLNSAIAAAEKPE
ncbi:MAG: hypothetical protein WC356_02165 [Candidatus Micrarchaeia archaeon]|jgi:hypothetical protein